MHFIGKGTQANGSEVTYVESHGMTGSKLGMRQALFASDVEFFFFFFTTVLGDFANQGVFLQER